MDREERMELELHRANMKTIDFCLKAQRFSQLIMPILEWRSTVNMGDPLDHQLLQKQCSEFKSSFVDVMKQMKATIDSMREYEMYLAMEYRNNNPEPESQKEKA